MLHLKVQKNNPDSDAEENILVDLLSRHNYKEENIIYPAIDKLATAEEKQVLFKQMEGFPKKDMRLAAVTTIKIVALPAEHGASVMLGESLLAGLLIAVSGHGFLPALGWVFLFLMSNPLKIAIRIFHATYLQQERP